MNKVARCKHDPVYVIILTVGCIYFHYIHLPGIPRSKPLTNTFGNVISSYMSFSAILIILVFTREAKNFTILVKSRFSSGCLFWLR